MKPTGECGDNNYLSIRVDGPKKAAKGFANVAQ